MNKKTYEIEMKVRDYELDVQGIVNNANYLHYLENTRHEFLQSRGISFSKDHLMGVDPVVARVDIRYMTPLTGETVFRSILSASRKGAKLLFHQEIRRKDDDVLCCKATVEVGILINGKLSRGDYYDPYLTDYLE